MILKRVIAIIVALGLIVGASVVRDRLFSTSTTVGPQTADDSTPAAAQLSAVCVTELASACAQLGFAELTTEPVQTTIANLAETPEAPADVWLTFTPWQDRISQAREESGATPLAFASSQVLGRSPVIGVFRDDRADALEQGCGGGITWECVGESAPKRWKEVGGQDSWGPVKVALSDPATTATGLLTLGQAASGFLGSPDFGRRELDGPGFFAWFSTFARSSVAPSSPTPVSQLVTQRAAFDMVFAIEAVAQPVLATAQADGLVSRDIGPELFAEVVAVGFGETGEAAVDALTPVARTALTNAGWAGRQAGSTPGPSTTGNNGVPGPGALEALRQTWLEVR